MSQPPPVARASSTPEYLGIYDFLAAQAQRIPNALALLAPGRAPLTYGRLHLHVEEVVQRLRAMGVSRQDRVALVLPNGPEMAVAFLAVAAGAACVPLNPAYSVHEFDTYLAQLHPKVLIVQQGIDSPVRAVAHARDLCIVELSVMAEMAAGLFTLTGDEQLHATSPAYAHPNDVALLLSTSGTTSRPKIVPLTHANLCLSAYYSSVILALGAGDRCVHVMPMFHAHGLVSQLLGPLMTGGSIVCPGGFDAAVFFACLAEFQPTWYSAVPTIHQAILAYAAAHRESVGRYTLRFVRSGSAPLPAQVFTELEGLFNAPVVEVYGLAEAVMITSNPLPPRQRKIGSVGVSVGPEIAIMDATGALLPVGATGEIVVRGANVFHGYDNDPVATQRAFMEGWFCTGDQGFLDAEGYLFITGRLKEIINRGGETITPGEIEDILMSHPGVAEAVAFAVPHARLGEEVAAAVVLHQHAAVTSQDLRAFAATRLADFKAPRQVLIVEAIPKSPTGKLQRLDLAEQLGLTIPQQISPTLPVESALPQTPLEETLGEIWAQVFGLEQVSPHEDFFQLGGDSILAAQLIARIREATRLEVSLRRFFAMPTVAGVARSIAQARQNMANLPAVRLAPQPRDGPRPLSYAQKRLWFLEQLGLNPHAATILEAVRLRGGLDVTALARSLTEITRRHEVWRATFINVAGEPQQIIRLATPLPLPVIDMQELPEGERQDRVYELARLEARRPFDLAGGPLVRTQLVRLAPEDWVFLLTIHHIVSDGWSHTVFWRELTALYTAFTHGKPSPLPELSVQYADFAYWQQQWLQGERLERYLTYWQQQLAGVSPLQLPTDHPRPAVQSFRGARQRVEIAAALTQALKTLSQHCGVTLFMTLLAALQTLLHRYTAQDDIVVGSLMANRTRVELEDLIGFFVNIVPLRTNLGGDPSFRELLRRVREVALEAYNYQELPYERLLESLQLTRDLSRNPLFQVLFAFQNTPRQAMAFVPLSLEVLEVEREVAELDLLLQLSETPQGLRGWFEYSTDLFDAATIARMAGHWQRLLESIVTDPEQRLSALPLLQTDERHSLVVAWNQTTADYPQAQCLHQMFEAQVVRTPDAVAVVWADASLTYGELNRRANRVAHYLQSLGVGPEVPVGLCIERSFEMVVGLLGILKAGGAYVPLDPTYPPERLSFMLQDAQVSILLTEEYVAERLPAHGAQVVCLDVVWQRIAQQSDQNPRSGVSADNAAYVLYTSGSTGTPKGVIGVHRATLNALAWMWQTYPFTRQEVCCQKTSINFGDSIQELFGPLLCGVPLVLVPHAVLTTLSQFVHTLAAQRVTRILLVPSLLRVLLDTYGDLQRQLPDLRLWMVSGESLWKELWQRFRQCMPDCRLVNLYGTSEGSDDTTWYDTGTMHPTLTSVPIGRPIANAQVYVLDRHLHPVPTGVAGELHIGGASLARGYLHRPELTAQTFIPHPFSNAPGARLYKTGDLARYLPDGNLEYLGRLDSQVKMSGVRIELEEIEAVLRQHPAVREAVVGTYEDIPRERCLVAYIVPAQEPGLTIKELRHFLVQTLPNYMLPTMFVRLTALPLTPSGKVDRRALPNPDFSHSALEESFAAPRTPLEQQVATIWTALLGLERLGIHDNFFELGGHSLLAMQLMYRVSEATQVDIPLLSFFETPTVAAMARIIETTTQAGQHWQTLPLVPVSRHGTLPASVTQEQLWSIDRMLLGVPFFHLPYAIRLVGCLQVAALEQSLNEVVRRHEALRTTFTPVDGQLAQVIATSLHVPLEIQDLGALPGHERESQTRRSIRAEIHRPFDLTQGPLLRCCLLRLDEQEHILLLVMHHIISDGWSLHVLMHELAVLYNAFSAGQPSPLPVLPIQYADFAYWQRQWQRSAVLETHLTYWRQQLHDPLPVLELPTDYSGREEGLRFLATARQALLLPRPLVEALKRLSYREGNTLFMTLLAAFKMLLYVYTGQEDLCVGSLVANRHRRETEGLIGLFVNTVILRTHLSGNPTGREVLRRVRATTLAAYAHQDLPFEELARALERERHLNRASLCQVMFILQDSMRPIPQPAAHSLYFLEAEPGLVELDSIATTFDVVLMLRERPQGLAGSCIYKSQLFAAATIARMLADFRQMLERIVIQPEQPLVAFHSQVDRAHGPDRHFT